MIRRAGATLIAAAAFVLLSPTLVHATHSWTAGSPWATTGTWDSATCGGYGYQVALGTGSHTASYSFSGAGLRIRGQMYSSSSNATIVIDGGEPQYLTFAGGDGSCGVIIDTFSLSPGSHTAVITPATNAGGVTIHPPEYAPSHLALDIEGTCEVTRYANVQSGDGFTGGVQFDVVPQEGTTDETSIDWDDTHSTSPAEEVTEYQHDYDDTEKRMVTISTTRTDDGDPTNTLTTSCQIELDPSTRAMNDAEYGGPPGTGDATDPTPDVTCSIWDVACWLRKLFIPEDDAFGNAWEDLAEAVTESYPFAPLFWAGDLVIDSAGGFLDGIDASNNNNMSNQYREIIRGEGATVDNIQVEPCEGGERWTQISIELSGWLFGSDPPTEIQDGVEQLGANRAARIGFPCEFHLPDWYYNLVKLGLLLWTARAIVRRVLREVSGNDAPADESIQPGSKASV